MMDEVDHVIWGTLIAIFSVAGVTLYKGIFDYAVVFVLGCGFIVILIVLIFKMLDAQSPTSATNV